MSKRMMLVALTALSAATACSSGGGNVTGNNSLNPTPLPSGATPATATPTAVASGATATPTANVTATPSSVATTTASPTASPIGIVPTATPTAIASVAPTASASAAVPTPTASATGGGTAPACTTSSAAPLSMTYTFTGGQQNITLPDYNNFAGTSMIPYNNQPNGNVTVEVSQNNFDGAPTSTNTYPNYAARQKDYFSTLKLGQTTTFYNDSAKTNKTNVPIYITETGPCIVAGTKYYVDLFALGSAQDENSAVATATSTAGVGTVTGPFHVTVNPFTGGLTADVVLSH